MSFVCPKANTDKTAKTVFCEPLPGRCTEQLKVTYQPAKWNVCDGLVCRLHGCQRADAHLYQRNLTLVAGGGR